MMRVSAGTVLQTALLGAFTVWLFKPDIASASPADPPADCPQVLGFKTPESVKLEHDELHEALVRATQAGGETGEAAKEVARLLHPHFEKEEEYALPPLSLLPQVSKGQITPQMREVIPLTDKLKADLPEMLQEHQTIVVALNRLSDAARRENKPEVSRFAEALKLHAMTEEEILYPSAILVGEYLKLRLR